MEGILLQMRRFVRFAMEKYGSVLETRVADRPVTRDARKSMTIIMGAYTALSQSVFG